MATSLELAVKLEKALEARELPHIIVAIQKEIEEALELENPTEEEPK